jgi:hypothetical protein
LFIGLERKAMPGKNDTRPGMSLEALRAFVLALIKSEQRKGNLGGGGGGSVDELDDIGDVNLTGLADGDFLIWDAGASEWINSTFVSPPHTHPWSDITSTPTTLAGYGITDAVPATRTISTTAPLSGGGDLSANRTLTTNMATNRLIGRYTGGAGVMEEVSIGANLTLSGAGVLSAATVGSSGAASIFGDGSDGTADFDGVNTFPFASLVGSTYTLTRDIYLTDMLVASGITVIADFRIYGTGALINEGTVQRNGKAAVANSGGPTQTVGFWGPCGVGGNAPASGTTTQAGSNGAQTGTNTGVLTAMGGAGGDGGNSNGGNGGTLLALAVTQGGLRDPWTLTAQTVRSPNTSATSTPVFGGFTGGSGGGGGGRTTGGTATVGGAGGGGAGVMMICFHTIDNSLGVISANGAAGANATGGTCSTGGGGGGGGGWIVLVYHAFTTGTETVTGGAAGTGLNGAAAADPGADGLITELQIV